MAIEPWDSPQLLSQVLQSKQLQLIGVSNNYLIHLLWDPDKPEEDHTPSPSPPKKIKKAPKLKVKTESNIKTEPIKTEPKQGSTQGHKRHHSNTSITVTTPKRPAIGVLTRRQAQQQFQDDPEASIGTTGEDDVGVKELPDIGDILNQ